MDERREQEAHRRTQELLGSFVSGDLSPEEEREITRHLERCAGCRAEEQELRQVHEYLDGFETPPLELKSRLFARLPRRRGRWHIGRWAPAAAAAVLLFFAVLSVLYSSGLLTQELTASATLEPMETETGASGEVRLYDTGPNMRVWIDVRDMPEPRPGEYYELWCMSDDDERVRGGSFTVEPGGRLEANMMVPELPSGYLRVEITSGATPEGTSSNKVLVGEFRTL